MCAKTSHWKIGGFECAARHTKITHTVSSTLQPLSDLTHTHILTLSLYLTSVYRDCSCHQTTQHHPSRRQGTRGSFPPANLLVTNYPSLSQTNTQNTHTRSRPVLTQFRVSLATPEMCGALLNSCSQCQRTHLSAVSDSTVCVCVCEFISM